MICLSRFSVLLFSFYRFATFIVHSMDAVRVCVLLWGTNRGALLFYFIFPRWLKSVEKLTQKNARKLKKFVSKGQSNTFMQLTARRTGRAASNNYLFSFSCLLLILSWDRVEIRLINWYWNQTKKIRRKSKNAQKIAGKNSKKTLKKLFRKKISYLASFTPRHKAVALSAFPSNVICSNIY
jgi:hypothetical protein